MADTEEEVDEKKNNHKKHVERKETINIQGIINIIPSNINAVQKRRIEESSEKNIRGRSTKQTTRN